MFATVDICVVFGLGPSIHGTGIQWYPPQQSSRCFWVTDWGWSTNQKNPVPAGWSKSGAADRNANSLTELNAATVCSTYAGGWEVPRGAPTGVTQNITSMELQLQGNKWWFPTKGLGLGCGDLGIDGIVIVIVSCCFTYQRSKFVFSCPSVFVPCMLRSLWRLGHAKRVCFPGPPRA